MRARVFETASQTRRVIISEAGESGWEVREEEGSRVIRSVHCTDWHRAERARRQFGWEAAALAGGRSQES